MAAKDIAREKKKKAIFSKMARWRKQLRKRINSDVEKSYKKQVAAEKKAFNTSLRHQRIERASEKRKRELRRKAARERIAEEKRRLAAINKFYKDTSNCYNVRTMKRLKLK